MASDDLNIHVRLTGARAAGAEAKGLRAEIVGVGKATGGAATSAGHWNRASAETTKRASVQGRVFKGLRGSVSSVGASYFHAAKGVAAAGLAFASFEGIKTAIENTDLLAQTTLRLTKNTKFDTQTASEWAAVAKVRGIDAGRLGQTLAKMSKQVEGGLHGQKASVELWKNLGISQGQLQASGKDMPGFLGKIADRFQAMGPGTERTAAAQALFGRSWQTLIPILRDGSKGLNEQLKMAKDYGAALGEGGTKSVEDFIKNQRKAQFAMLGFQVTLGLTVIPVLTKALQVFAKLSLGFRKGTGDGGKLRHALEQIWHSAKPVVVWFGRAAINIAKFAGKHPGLVKVAAALLLASKALKIMRFGSAIRGAGLLWGALNKVVTSRFGAKIAESVAGKTGLGSLIGKAGPKISAFGSWMKGQMGSIGRIAGGALLTFLDFQLADWATQHGMSGSKLSHIIFPLSPQGQKPPGIHTGTKNDPIPISPRQFQNLGGPSPGATRGSPYRPHGNPRIMVPPGPGTSPIPAAPDAGMPPTVVHSVLNLDGKTIWESWDKHDRNRRARR